MIERLQKILARSGYGSRRSCEVIIEEGRVRVNGQVALIGQKADPEADRIEVDGRRLHAEAPLAYIALYKPRNVISSVDDPAGRRTVTDLVPESRGLYPVGRLDWDSEGLVLMTNDGELTNRLTHPRYGHTKEYRVLVSRRPDSEQLRTWRSGVVLGDGHRTAPAKVDLQESAGKGAWLRITMGEGRKRQIRETGALLGLPVVRIIRTSISTLGLGKLKPGEWRFLAAAEVRSLKGQAASPRRLPQPARKRRRASVK